MATATITLTDDDEGVVDVTVDFGKEGSDSKSQAHQLALAMVRHSPGEIVGDIMVEKING